MPNYDLSSATLGRVANQTVDMLRIADQIVWAANTTDGPYYLNDAASASPGSFSDGTPNIVTGHLMIFHNDGFVTGLQWFDLDAAAGNWIFGIREVTTSDGSSPDTGISKIQGKTITATGAGFRNMSFDAPAAVEFGKMYLVTRYSATGYYVHTAAFDGAHGAFTDADPVYFPSIGEDVSPVIPGWTAVRRALFSIGSGDVVPTGEGAHAFYGVTPIFYKSL